MIRQLSQELINKIAAGEVVERPNSVVKELVENSLDAGSTFITVEIDEGLIKITDNGTGIFKEDLSKLFTNHSTSKIKSIEDLTNIHTMGFRGEAIATIASVSHIEIKSKTVDSPQGWAIRAGEKPVPAAVNQGTIVEVRDLFYNVPARKKFLKSESVENKYIIDTITKIAIANPDIGFKLTIKGKLIYNLIQATPENRLKALIPNIELIPLIQDDIINGFISAPKDTFSKATYQYMFANGRYITPSPALNRAIYTGYKNSIMRGQYPPYVIFINVNPENIDVNVHPRKTEVRFENEGYIFQKIYSVIQHTLFREENPVFIEQFSQFKEQEQENRQSPDTNTFYPHFTEKKNFVNDSVRQESIFPGISPKVSNAMEFSSTLLQAELADVLNKVNIYSAHQYMLSYIVTEMENGMVVFDQHACSERFLFEKYKMYFQDKKVLTKKLLIPEVIPNEHIEFLLEKSDILASFGIIVEEAQGIAQITEIPEFATLRIIDQLYAEIKLIFDSEMTSVMELRDKMITTLACHSAIRFGDKLSDQECQKILSDLMTCKNKLTCPHGRPTYYEMPKERLVQIFKR